MKDSAFLSPLGTPHRHWLADLNVQKSSPLTSRLAQLCDTVHASEPSVGSSKSYLQMRPHPCLASFILSLAFFILPPLRAHPQHAAKFLSQSLFLGTHTWDTLPIYKKHTWHKDRACCLCTHETPVEILFSSLLLTMNRRHISCSSKHEI